MATQYVTKIGTNTVKNLIFEADKSIDILCENAKCGKLEAGSVSEKIKEIMKKKILTS